MSGVRIHFLKDLWKFAQIHQYYTMALRVLTIVMTCLISLSLVRCSGMGSKSFSPGDTSLPYTRHVHVPPDLMVDTVIYSLGLTLRVYTLVPGNGLHCVVVYS